MDAVLMLVNTDNNGPAWRRFVDMASDGRIIVRADKPGAVVETIPVSSIIVWIPSEFEGEAA